MTNECFKNAQARKDATDQVTLLAAANKELEMTKRLVKEVRTCAGLQRWRSCPTGDGPSDQRALSMLSFCVRPTRRHSHPTVKSRLTILAAVPVLWQFEDEKDALKQSVSSLKKQVDDLEEAVKRERAKLEQEQKSHEEDLKRVAGFPEVD